MEKKDVVVGAALLSLEKKDVVVGAAFLSLECPCSFVSLKSLLRYDIGDYVHVRFKDHSKVIGEKGL